MKKAKDIFYDTKEKEEVTIAQKYKDQALFQAENGNYNNAKKLLMKSLSSLNKIHNTEAFNIAVDVYFELGEIAYKVKHYDEAEKHILESLSLAVSDRKKRKCNFLLGDIALQKSEFENANSYFVKSLETSRKLIDYDLILVDHRKLAITANEQENYEQARYWLNNALELAERYSDEQESTIIQNMLGYIAHKQNDFDFASGWYEKSVNEHEDNSPLKLSTYLQLASISCERDDFDTAKMLCNRVLQIIEEGIPYDKDILSGRALEMLANISLNQKDILETIRYVILAMQSFEVIKNLGDKLQQMTLSIFGLKSLHKKYSEEIKAMILDSNLSIETKNNFQKWEEHIVMQTETLKQTFLLLALDDPEFESFKNQFEQMPDIEVPGATLSHIYGFLAEDTNYAKKAQKHYANSYQNKTFGLPGLTEAGIFIAAIFLLRSHIRIKVNSEGKWEILFEHKPAQNDLLRIIVDSLNNILNK